MVGYNFKSDIIFYKVPGNKNGKMSQRVYIDLILQPHVLPKIEKDERFVLEEDRDLGYSLGKNNLVKQ
jgi:hypothetical protein